MIFGYCFFFWLLLLPFSVQGLLWEILSGIWLWVHQILLSVEGNLDFGGLLAKETLPGFGFLGTSLIKLHVDIFRGAVDAWGRFLFHPLFLFCQRHGHTVIYGPVKLLLIKPTGRERTGLWILHVQTAKYPCPM